MAGPNGFPGVSRGVFRLFKDFYFCIFMFRKDKYNAISLCFTDGSVNKELLSIPKENRIINNFGIGSWYPSVHSSTGPTSSE